jgi:hypothetical protein
MTVIADKISFAICEEDHIHISLLDEEGNEFAEIILETPAEASQFHTFLAEAFKTAFNMSEFDSLHIQ